MGTGIGLARECFRSSYAGYELAADIEDLEALKSEIRRVPAVEPYTETDIVLKTPKSTDRWADMEIEF